jgi:putative iron-regulated protein
VAQRNLWARARVAVAVAGMACLPVALSACGDDTASTTRADVIAHYATGVHASYSASLASATTMDTAIDAFVAAPTPANMQAARDAWLAARDDYGLTEVFRFYGGPIDNEKTGREGQINAWPMDEAYLDYVDGTVAGGLVNTPAALPTISGESIAALNEKGGETNIATGWHAIEFLLWGQDLSDDGPGARPATDYTTLPGAKRRGQYLTTTSDLLVSDLTELVAAWAPDDAKNYRAEFVALPEEDALRNIMVGMGELSRGELAGERMNVAYSERSQEDEHSCFSDNTTADFIANAAGIRMAYTGAYPGADGPGVSALVAEADADLDAKITTALNTSVANAEAIPGPFDQLVREGLPDSDPGREAVLATIVGLEDQGDLMVDAGTALGVTVVLS